MLAVPHQSSQLYFPLTLWSSFSLHSDAPCAAGGTRRVTVVKSFICSVIGIKWREKQESTSIRKSSRWLIVFSGHERGLPENFCGLLEIQHCLSSGCLITVTEASLLTPLSCKQDFSWPFTTVFLSAVSFHCLLSEQAILKSWKPYPRVKREFQIILLVLKFGRVSWARITKGIDLCSQ